MRIYSFGTRTVFYLCREKRRDFGIGMERKYLKHRVIGMAMKRIYFPICVVFLGMVFNTVYGGEVFTSVAKMKLLPQIEHDLIHACHQFLHNKDHILELEDFKRFLTSAREENERALSDNNFLENPVNAFRFLWRLVDGWQRATKTRCSDSCQQTNSVARNFLQQIRASISSVSSWPTHEDISGSAIAITNLVHTYDLDPGDFVKGRLLQTQTEPLTGDELFALSEEVHHYSSLDEARSWVNMTVGRLEEMRGEEKLLREAHYRLREIEEKFESRKRNGLPVKEDIFYAVGEEEQEADDNTSITGFYQSVYENLCQGQVKTPGELSTLSCWYKETHIPYLRAKVELLNEDPAIYVFHDVISDNEIEQMKNISLHLLKRSMLGNPDGSGHEGKKERISQSAWLFDDTDVTPQLSKRVELMTGLSTTLQKHNTHAEAYQVLNYGLGGMYEPHEDSVRVYRRLGYEKESTIRNSGDRIATWLFYMSDVTAGGATVFPILKTRVPAAKGTAAFWYNLRRNGEADTRTIHAGCPVLIGDKWVANKWIREIGQTFRRPCSLDPDE